MFAAYVSARGHAFIDPALYLPKSWTNDPAKVAATHVPETVAFATKPALAVEMIQRTLAANVPFSWVAADAVYGVGDVEARYDEPAKAMFSKSNPITTSAPGQASLWSLAKRKRSRLILPPMRGSASMLARVQKAPFVTGATANSPISKQTNMMIRNRVYGPGAS